MLQENQSVPAFRVQECKPGQRVVIYGAGRHGKLIFLVLKAMGIQVESFVDIVKIGEFCGIPIITPDILRNNTYTGGYKIIIASAVCFYTIKGYLDKLGILNYYHGLELITWAADKKDLLANLEDNFTYLYVTYKRSVEDHENSFYLPQVSIQVTEKCTLKCRDCSVLAGYYKQPQEYKVQEVEEGLDRLLQVVDGIYQISFLNEPFIYKDLQRLLKKYVDNSKIYEIVLVTNGTVLPPEHICDCLKHEKIKVSMSDYGLLSRKKEIFQKTLRDKGIAFLSLADENTKWKKMLITEKQIKREKRCLTTCHSLIKNRVFYCTTGANAVNLKAMPDNPGDYIDLGDSSITQAELRDKLQTYFSTDNALEICKYCGFNWNESEDVERAVQVSEPIAYKEYT